MGASPVRADLPASAAGDSCPVSRSRVRLRLSGSTIPANLAKARRGQLTAHLRSRMSDMVSSVASDELASGAELDHS